MRSALAAFLCQARVRLQRDGSSSLLGGRFAARLESLHCSIAQCCGVWLLLGAGLEQCPGLGEIRAPQYGLGGGALRV